MNTLESCIPWLNASCDPAIFSDSNFCQLNPSVRRQRRWRWWCRWCRDGRRRFRAGFAVCGNGCLLVFVTQTHAHTHKHSVSQSAKHTYTHTLQLQRLLMLLLRCAALMMMWRWWWLSLSICLDSHFGDNIYLGFTKNQSQWICGRLFQPFCCRRRGLVAVVSSLCCVCCVVRAFRMRCAFNRSVRFYDFDWHTIYDIQMELLLHTYIFFDTHIHKLRCRRQTKKMPATTKSLQVLSGRKIFTCSRDSGRFKSIQSFRTTILRYDTHVVCKNSPAMFEYQASPRY